MRVLLDTHVLLWSYIEPNRLSGTASTALLDASVTKLVSPASYWEIAIKVSVGKYSLNESIQDFVQHAVIDNGFQILPIEPRHAAALIGMPFVHRDPFDRLLIAQAMVEGLSLVSTDAVFDQYQIARLW